MDPLARQVDSAPSTIGVFVHPLAIGSRQVSMLTTPPVTVRMLGCVAVPVLLVCATAAAQEWTRLRGPNGEGHSSATTIPTQWTDKDYKWRVELPGIGYSSPVIWGQRVFVTSALEADATQIVRCLRTSDGSLVWEQRFPSCVHPRHRFNCYASSTPTVDEDRLYFCWGNPKNLHVVALDHEQGRTVWSRELGPFEGEHAFGASPILVDDLVIIPNDQDPSSSVIALDTKTGATRWTAKRDKKLAGYATPFLFQTPSVPPQLIIAASKHGLTSLDPKTGKMNWELAVLPHRVVGSGTVASGLIVAGSGGGGVGLRTVAVRPAVPGQQAEPKVVYELPKGTLPYVPAPIGHGSLLFLWFDKGVVSCLDAPTGKVHWRERIGGDFFGSPVCVNGRLYCISRDGEVVVLAAADRYELLARVKLGERSNSTPAISEGVMYLRTVSHLMALGG